MSGDIQERFERFHRDNPHVLRELEELAQQWFDAGNRSVAIGMLWETLRWKSGISTQTSEPYKLNDHFRSRYVRLMIERHPEWADRFETRQLRAA